MSTVSSARKRRGTIRSSITRLLRRLSDLEGRAAEPTTFDLAQDVARRLDELDKDFRAQVLDLIDEEDEVALDNEQKELDAHDDIIDDAKIRVRELVALSSSSINSSKRKTLSRQQCQLEKVVIAIRDTVTPLTATSESCLIHQCKERLQVYKSELKELNASILDMTLMTSTPRRVGSRG